MAQTLSGRAPSFSPRVEELPRIRSVKFGDGYEGRYGDGLNNLLLRVEVPWNSLTQAEFNVFISFFRAHRGIAWFNWTMPGDTQNRKWVVRSWNWQRTQDSPANRPTFDLVASFDEVADLIG